jgi:hypothetical protein
MGLQLPLPAGWAIHLASHPDPGEHLLALKRDTDDAKVEIRAILERLAEKHGASTGAVNQAMRGYIDDMLGDLLYEVERGIEREIEEGAGE